MEKFNVPVILGTARDDRQSEKVARFIFNEISKNISIESIFIDVKDYLFGSTRPSWIEDSETKKWKEIAQNADGYIIVTPEYNHGYPGELKLLLDSAYKEYSDKPTLIVAVSRGRLSGARVADHIKPVLIELGMIPFRNSLYFGNIETLFNTDGTITDPKMLEVTTKTIDKFIKYMNTIKYIRT